MKLDGLFDDLAELSENAFRVRAMAAAIEQLRAAPDEAGILLRPLD